MNHDPHESKSSQVQAVLADCLLRRAGGEAISDEEILGGHSELGPELEVALKKMRFIDAVFDAAEQTVDEMHVPTVGTKSTVSGLGVRCPACRTLIEMAETESLASVTCCACDTTFRLVDDEGLDDATLADTLIGHFRLKSLLGKGAFGSVWRAYDVELDRDVAVKLPRSGRLTEDEAGMFLREARAAAQLTHPNIVTIYEVGRDDQRLYIVSDVIDGETLAERLRHSSLSANEAALMCYTIALALHEAHEAGVIHRDLKPSNILLDQFTEPHVTDFGLAKRAGGELTMTGTGQVLGTPAYMSPEQAEGESHQADRRSDIYALGVILFELLTGETPFRGSPQMLFAQVLHDEPPRPRKLNQTVPRDLETICLKCLEKKPEQRYSSARELADDLYRWQNKQPIAARPVGPIGRAVRWSQRKPAVATLLVTIVAVTLAGLAGVSWQWRATTAALALEKKEHARADENLRTAGKVVDDFLTSMATKRLVYEPRTQDLQKELLMKAANYYEAIAASNTDDPQIQLEVAKAHRSLAHLRREFGESAAAADHAESALKILAAIAPQNQDQEDAQHREMAATLIALGKLNAEPSAEGAEPGANYLAAHELLQQPLARQPDDLMCLRLDADALAKLGSLYRRRQHPDAVSTLEASVSAWEHILELDSKQPTFYDFLGRSYLDLALLHLDQGPYQTALQHAQRSLELQLEGLELDDQFWPCRSTLAFSQATVARAHNLLGNSEAAIEFLEQAIATRQEVVDAFPDTISHRHNLANQLHRLAETHMHLNHVDAALPHIEREIALRQAMREQLPGNHMLATYLAGALVNRCDALLLQARFEEALVLTEEVLTILDDGVPGHVSDVSKAHAHMQASTAHAKMQAFDAAQQSSTEALGALQPWLEKLPHDLLIATKLLDVLWSRAQIHQQAGELDLALEAAQTALEYGRELIDRFPQEPNIALLLPRCLVSITQWHVELEDWPSAHERCVEAIVEQPLQFAADPGATNAINMAATLLASHAIEGRMNQAIELVERLTSVSDTPATRVSTAAALSSALATIADSPASQSQTEFITDCTSRALNLYDQASSDELARQTMRQLDSLNYLRGKLNPSPKLGEDSPPQADR